MIVIFLIIILASSVTLTSQTKPILQSLTQFNLNDGLTIVEVNLTYNGLATKLAIWNCRYYLLLNRFKSEHSSQLVKEVETRKDKSQYIVRIDNPVPGDTCYKICSKCEGKYQEWSETKFISVLTYKSDLESLLRVEHKVIHEYLPYILRVEQHRTLKYTYNIHFYIKYDGRFSRFQLFACRYRYEPFTITQCRKLHNAPFSYNYVNHKVTLDRLHMESGNFTLHVCLYDGRCSPPFLYETKTKRDLNQLYPYVTRVSKMKKVGVTDSIIVKWHFDESKSQRKMFVYAGTCVRDYNLVLYVNNLYEKPATPGQKLYSVVFKNLRKRRYCILACDGSFVHDRCGYPIMFNNNDEPIQKQGYPQIARIVKKSRFGYSNEVEIYYGMPPSLFKLSRIIDFYRCQYKENPFTVFNYSWAGYEQLETPGAGKQYTIKNMPIGDTCILLCGVMNSIEVCSLPYKIDNYVKTRKTMDSANSPQVTSLKKFTKFAYSNNVNISWHFSREMSEKFRIINVYTCQYTEPPLTTFNYTLAIQIEADKNRENYKFEVYNLPIGHVCIVICGDSKSTEMCGSIYKFENKPQQNLKNFPDSNPKVSGMKRLVKYGYTGGIELEINFPLKLHTEYPELTVYRCEYTLYPHYQTYNYTIATRINKLQKKENFLIQIQGLPIGLACIHICADNGNFDTCGLPFRLKNTRIVDETEYTQNRPRIIQVTKPHERGYSSIGTVRFTYPNTLIAKYDTIAIYRCKYLENPLRTYAYSLAMELRVSNNGNIYTVQVDELPKGKACIQICAMNEHFERCGMPYTFENN